MTCAQTQDDTLYGYSAWAQALSQAKIEMGLSSADTVLNLNRQLVQAVLKDDHAAVRAGVALGANPTLCTAVAFGEQGEWGSLLHIAVRRQSLKTVVALLEAKADPYARDSAGRLPRSLAQRFSLRCKTDQADQIWAVLRQAEHMQKIQLETRMHLRKSLEIEPLTQSLSSRPAKGLDFIAPALTLIRSQRELA